MHLHTCFGICQEVGELVENNLERNHSQSTEPQTMLSAESSHLVLNISNGSFITTTGYHYDCLVSKHRDDTTSYSFNMQENIFFSLSLWVCCLPLQVT